MSSAVSSDLMGNVVFRFKEKNYGSSGATSGLTSSLAFTPVQVYIYIYIFKHEFIGANLML